MLWGGGGGGQVILFVVSRGINVFTFSLEGEGSGKICRVINQDLSPLPPPRYLNNEQSLRRTTIKSRKSSKFGLIRPRTAVLSALERMNKFPWTYNGRNVVSTMAPSIDWIFFILVGNNDYHKSLYELELQLTAELVVVERLKLMYNLVSTLAPSFLIGSSSFLRVRRTTIKSETSSNFSPIRPQAAALERMKKYHRVIMGDMSLAL